MLTDVSSSEPDLTCVVSDGGPVSQIILHQGSLVFFTPL